ncbi:MAG: PAS domain S-box protein [Thermoanaerobaculia bacterium]|nr:PAS domain S-box protein [Thermoanaerobaculia bacterium]
MPSAPLPESGRPRWLADPAAAVYTAVVAGIGVWVWVGVSDAPTTQLLVIPPTFLALWWGLARVADRRRRRFWWLWIGALAIWWVANLLLAQGILDSIGLQVASLPGYLLVLVAIAARPRGISLESQQASVHRLRLSAMLTASLTGVAYTLLLRDGDSASPVSAAVLPLLDLCGALLLLHLALRLHGRLRWTNGWLGVGLLLLGVLHSLDAASVDVGSAAALEVLPFWCIGIAGRLRKVDQQIPKTTDTRLFPLPSAVWIGLLPLLHLGLDPAAAYPVGLRAMVIISTGFLTLLALAEHGALSRRSNRLEVERREAARRFETRSVYLQSLIAHNPLPIVVLDAEQNVRLCNPAFERTFGYTSDEVSGLSLDHIISTDEFRRQASSYTARVLTGETVHAATKRRRKDGTEIDVEVWGVPLMEQDVLIGIFAIYQDITDRKRAETALRDSEERFRRLADATFEGIVVSQDGVVVDCNEQYAHMVGGSVEEIVGRPVLDFVAAADHQLVGHHLKRNLEEAYEHRALTLDDRELRVEVHARALSSDGRRMRVSAVRDVTAHRRLEEEMRQAQKMEAVGRLAGGIAHDFNNVLTVIMGYAQLLSVRLQDSPLANQVVEIHEAADRASLMTQRLLAFGRKQALQPQKLDLNEVLRGTEKMVRRLIRADIDLQLDLDSELGAIRADPGQLEQVVLNLVINAGDAMPKGGTLRLRTRNIVVGADDTETLYAAPGSYVELQVRDSGHGMDEATRSQVFEPFFTTKEQGKGTGLGLATVYAIVQQNGGVIDVQTEVDRGSTFSILLPRILDSTADDTVDFLLPELPRGQETVLVVEDEPGVRSLAREFLLTFGYQVIEASDGKQALALFDGDAAAPRVDLVLTDVVMPGLNGPEMARHLMQQQPDLRVLFMSGYTDEILAPEDLATSWLLVQKPFSMEELLHKVRAVLDHEPLNDDDQDQTEAKREGSGRTDQGQAEVPDDGSRRHG